MLHYLTRDLTELESDSTLFRPDELLRRIDALHQLEALSAALLADVSPAESQQLDPIARVTALREKLELANTRIYEAIRCDIRQSGRPHSLLQWIDTFRDGTKSFACGPGPLPGLGYDALDDFAAGILQLREPQNAPLHPGPEQVFYQPSPVRHILHLLELTDLSESDVLIDLGAGLGHACILASILTGARTIGIELQGAYIASARECARSLHLDRVSFREQDARQADLSAGTVFYLYTPFSGSLLSAVLRKLQEESASRPIRICTLGPCADIIANQPWLKATTMPSTDKVALFVSRDRTRA